MMPVLPNKYYLFGSIFALLLCTPVAAENEETIARCAKIASVGDRILCLENALRRASGDSNRVSDADEMPTPEAATVEPASAAADHALAGSESEVITEARHIPEPASEELVPEISPDVSVSSTATPANELGAEQVAQRNDSNDPTATRVNANIVAFDVVGTGRLRFRLDNDQVWQQIGDDHMNLSRKLRGADIVPVEMWRSRFGGYRMQIISINRTVKVKRVK
jgi:hypothetical protein